MILSLFAICIMILHLALANPSRVALRAGRRSLAVRAASNIKFEDGKTVAITGANRGLGLEFAKQILAKSPKSRIIGAVRSPQDAGDLVKIGGDRVTVLQVRGEIHTRRALRLVKGSFANSTCRAPFCLQLDVADEASIRAFARELKSRFGSIDMVLNNSGVYGEESRGELGAVTARGMMDAFQVQPFSLDAAAALRLRPEVSSRPVQWLGKAENGRKHHPSRLLLSPSLRHPGQHHRPADACPGRSACCCCWGTAADFLVFNLLTR